MEAPPITPNFEDPKAKVSGFAVAGLLCSLLWLGGIGSAMGLLFGYVGKQQTVRRERRGDIIANAALLLGAIGLIATAALLADALGIIELPI